MFIVASDLFMKGFGRQASVIRSDLDTADFSPSEAGALSFFEGSRRGEQTIVRRGCPLVLCLDIKSDPRHNLSKPDLQRQIQGLVIDGMVAIVGGGPSCSSMSIAVTPPTRSREFPNWKTNLLFPVRTRCRLGNQLANWSARIYRGKPMGYG